MGMLPRTAPEMIEIFSFVMGSDAEEIDSVYETCFTILNAEEQARANRFVHPKPRREFVLTRAGLRGLLSHRAGISPHEIVFLQNAAGKPFMAKGECHFNVSHSHGVSLIALSPKQEVGVDIEPVRDLPSREGLARRWFHPREVLALETSGWDPQTFFAIWTAKEAVVKAMGTGLGFGMDEVWIDATNPSAPRLCQLGKTQKGHNDWILQSKKIQGTHLACVAYRGTNLPIVWRELGNPLDCIK